MFIIDQSIARDLCERFPLSLPLNTSPDSEDSALQASSEYTLQQIITHIASSLLQLACNIPMTTDKEKWHNALQNQLNRIAQITAQGRQIAIPLSVLLASYHDDKQVAYVSTEQFIASIRPYIIAYLTAQHCLVRDRALTYTHTLQNGDQVIINGFDERFSWVQKNDGHNTLQTLKSFQADPAVEPSIKENLVFKAFKTVTTVREEAAKHTAAVLKRYPAALQRKAQLKQAVSDAVPSIDRAFSDVFKLSDPIMRFITEKAPLAFDIAVTVLVAPLCAAIIAKFAYDCVVWSLKLFSLLTFCIQNPRQDIVQLQRQQAGLSDAPVVVQNIKSQIKQLRNAQTPQSKEGNNSFQRRSSMLFARPREQDPEQIELLNFASMQR